MTFLSILTINKKLRPIGSDIPLFESPFISYDLLACKLPSFSNQLLTVTLFAELS
jgi:hypothetical protein